MLDEILPQKESKKSNSYIFPIVPAGIAGINKTISFAESGLFLWIISEQWPVHESNSKTEFGTFRTFGKYTFLTQVSK